MTQFDDLNEALAALQNEMKAATTATQAVSRLGEAASAMTKHAGALESRLKVCEDRISTLDQSILRVKQSVENLGEKTTRQWKEAVAAVMAEASKEYVDAVENQVKEAGKGFQNSITALRTEWVHRENSLKRARKWVWVLSIVLTLTILGIAGFIYFGVNRI